MTFLKVIAIIIIEDANHAPISSEDWQVFSWGRVCTWLSVCALQLASSSVAEAQPLKQTPAMKTLK